MTIQTHDHYEPQWTICDRLRRVRRDAGLTQAKFAAQLGILEKRYSAWESDTNTPGGDQLISLARAVGRNYGFSASSFVLGMDPVTQPDPDPPSPSGEQVGDLQKMAERKRARTRRSNTAGYVRFPAQAA